MCPRCKGPDIGTGPGTTGKGATLLGERVPEQSHRACVWGELVGSVGCRFLGGEDDVTEAHADTVWPALLRTTALVGSSPRFTVARPPVPTRPRTVETPFSTTEVTTLDAFWLIVTSGLTGA